MLEAGARVEVHDQYVKDYPGVIISHDLNEVIRGTDAIAIFIGHDQYTTLTAENIKALVKKNIRRL